MENSHRDERPKTIIRQAEVLRRTGFSRSTLYCRIAKGEFPRQVSLGGRAVGWVVAEVDAWIAQRASMRPDSDSEAWLREEEARDKTLTDLSSQITPVRKSAVRNCPQTHEAKRRSNVPIPDLTQLELIGTKVYVDRTTGTLWFQVLPPERSSD